MVIKSLEQRKRQQILLIVALVIFLAAVLVLYFSFWKKEKIVTTEEVPQVLPQEEEEQIPTALEEKLIRISLDFEFLNQKILPFLKIYGDLPVKKGQTGRDNPFVPY